MSRVSTVQVCKEAGRGCLIPGRRVTAGSKLLNGSSGSQTWFSLPEQQVLLTPGNVVHHMPSQTLDIHS